VIIWCESNRFRFWLEITPGSMSIKSPLALAPRKMEFDGPS
jgi:hypothetical protein